mmetsp:Transcript_57158/g.129502  ORF Transcript_57158/g.129502 Transcript_57158/m.129502 type:complete len:231 (+) Transcript_57158:871-1563(+)
MRRSRFWNGPGVPRTAETTAGQRDETSAPEMAPLTCRFRTWHPVSARTSARMRVLSSATAASASSTSTKYCIVKRCGSELWKRGLPPTGSPGPADPPARPHWTTRGLDRRIVSWISQRHQTRRKGIARRSSGSRTAGPPCAAMKSSSPTRSMASTTIKVAPQRWITPRKSMSELLPGHCRTAKRSIQTRQSGESSVSAATSVPQQAPQQCEMKISAGPTEAAVATPGSST